MNITSEAIFNSVLYGANEVIKIKEELNKINVFPVPDGDTGSNIASMMRTIIAEAELKQSVKETVDSIANAAILGARGNSGIIFAGYLLGLSEAIVSDVTISLEEFAHASKKAVKYAYDAIEVPVDGTIITVMEEWGNALVDKCSKYQDIVEVFDYSIERVNKALENTKNQLNVLKKANVVDSGAKAFTSFVFSIYDYFKHGEIEVTYKKEDYQEVNNEINSIHSHLAVGENRYCTECLIDNFELDRNILKTEISNFGDSLVVVGNSRKCRIHIHTKDPELFFEYINNIGKVVYQKVEDMKKQADIVNNRKNKIAIVTDSIADLPKQYFDDEQIHLINLEIINEDRIYLDKLTISPKKMLEQIKFENNLPTSSQPNSKKIENLFDYLSSYYESVIVLTVSKELSGTYNSFMKAANNYQSDNFKISVINTKQNSGAQGLIVKSCNELISQGFSHNEIVNKINEIIEKSKILVQVKTIDNMIKSGRLSINSGKIAKFVNLKPIVTLDKDGKGGLDSIAFSEKRSMNQLLKHIKKITKEKGIRRYSVVHVNNYDAALALSKDLKKIIGFDVDYITETSTIVALGAGEGAIAVSYVTK